MKSEPDSLCSESVEEVFPAVAMQAESGEEDIYQQVQDFTSGGY